MSLESIGILNFYNAEPKIDEKLTIKQKYEDFVVKEISKHGICNDSEIINVDEMKIAVDFVMDIIKNEDTELYKTIKNDICALKQYTTAKKNDAETKANINLYDIITEYGMQLCEIKEQEKNKRAEIHAIVKKHPLFAAKTTSDNTIIIKRVKTNRTYMMTMKKTYKDTITACNIIASALKIPFNKVSFAGNKDKRAITYQKITIEGCSFAKIMELAVKLKKEYKSIAIFDVKQCNSSIKLGELEGNKFDIRIRQINDENAEKNIQTCEEYIECNNEQQLQSEKINNNNWIDKINPFVLEQGFINYYGQQRFGKNYNNHLIGEFIVNGEYEKVIDMIMSINQYDSDKIKEAKQQFENEQYETATKLMPFACNVEKSICIGKKKQQSDKKIINGLKRESIKLYMHAYQSYIFNNKVNKEISKCLDKQKLYEKSIGLEVRNNKHMKGDSRKIVEVASNVKMIKEEDCVVISFTLKPSCYATMALREIIGDAVLYNNK